MPEICLAFKINEFATGCQQDARLRISTHTHMNWWFVNVCNIQSYKCMYICIICMYLRTFAMDFTNSQNWTWMYVGEFRRYLHVHIMEHTNILCSSCMSYLFPRGRTLMLKKLWPGRCLGFAKEESQFSGMFWLQSFGGCYMVLDGFFYHVLKRVFSSSKNLRYWREASQRNQQLNRYGSQPISSGWIAKTCIFTIFDRQTRFVVVTLSRCMCFEWTIKKSVGSGNCTKNMTLGWSEDDTRVG